MPRNNSVTIENARIIFRNFTGREDQYNAEGERNFSVVLQEDDAAFLLDQGWNIKRTNPRDEEEVGVPYVQVKISYKVMTPLVWMISERGRTSLSEDMLGLLDNVEIRNVDLVMNPSRWNVGSKSGIKAYLEALYITIVEDKLMSKYSGLPDAMSDRED